MGGRGRVIETTKGEFHWCSYFSGRAYGGRGGADWAWRRSQDGRREAGVDGSQEYEVRQIGYF